VSGSNSNEEIIVATTRLETMLGSVELIVHPCVYHPATTTTSTTTATTTTTTTTTTTSSTTANINRFHTPW
jgi:valyl-tRNA synthetase